MYSDTKPEYLTLLKHKKNQNFHILKTFWKNLPLILVKNFISYQNVTFFHEIKIPNTTNLGTASRKLIIWLSSQQDFCDSFKCKKM